MFSSVGTTSLPKTAPSTGEVHCCGFQVKKPVGESIYIYPIEFQPRQQSLTLGSTIPFPNRNTLEAFVEASSTTNYAPSRGAPILPEGVRLPSLENLVGPHLELTSQIATWKGSAFFFPAAKLQFADLPS